MTCSICAHAIEHGSWPTDHRGTHCMGQSLSLFALRDCDSSLRSYEVPLGFKPTPDGSRISTEQPANLDSAHATVVKPLQFFDVHDPMRLSVFLGAYWSKVSFAVVGLDVIDVVDLAIGEPSDEPVLVTLDVLVRPDFPPEPDISMGADVPSRLAVGDLIERIDLSDDPRRSLVALSTLVTSLPAVPHIDHFSLATYTGPGGVHVAHNPMIALIHGCHRSWSSKAQSHCTVCHRHFGSNSAGDAHRVGDYRYGRTPECRDPKGFPVWETDQGPIFGGRDPKAAAERIRAARRGSVVERRATETERVEP